MRVQLRLLPKVLATARLELPRLMRYLALVERQASPRAALVPRDPGRGPRGARAAASAPI